MSECLGHVCCKYYVGNLCKLNRQQNSNAAGMDFSTGLKYNLKFPFFVHILFSIEIYLRFGKDLITKSVKSKLSSLPTLKTPNKNTPETEVEVIL